METQQPLVIRAQTSDVAPPRWGRRLRRLALGLLLLLVAGLVAAWLVTPSGTDVQSRVAARATALRVSQLTAGEMPDGLANAIVATEDERTFGPRRADPVGLAGQVAFDMRYGCECRIDPMMTREVVRTVYFGDGSGPARPWTDAEETLVTVRVEQTLNARVALADELTLASFGDGLTGAPAASQTLFNRPLDRLDLAQAATLAAIRQGGSAADPREHPDDTRARRGQVLLAMVADGYVTPAAAAVAQAEPLLPEAAATPGPAAPAGATTQGEPSPSPPPSPSPAATPAPSRSTDQAAPVVPTMSTVAESRVGVGVQRS